MFGSIIKTVVNQWHLREMSKARTIARQHHLAFSSWLLSSKTTRLQEAESYNIKWVVKSFLTRLEATVRLILLRCFIVQVVETAKKHQWYDFSIIMLTLGRNLLFPSGTELTKESVVCHWTRSHIKSILLFVFYTFNPHRVGVNQNQKL